MTNLFIFVWFVLNPDEKNIIDSEIGSINFHNKTQMALIMNDFFLT